LHILVINSSTAHAYNIDNNDLRGWILLLIGPFIPGTACALARPSFFHANFAARLRFLVKCHKNNQIPSERLAFLFFWVVRKRPASDRIIGPETQK